MFFMEHDVVLLYLGNKWKNKHIRNTSVTSNIFSLDRASVNVRKFQNIGDWDYTKL